MFLGGMRSRWGRVAFFSLSLHKNWAGAGLPGGVSGGRWFAVKHKENEK